MQVPFKKHIRYLSIIITKEDQSVGKYFFDFDFDAISQSSLSWIFQDKRDLSREFIDKILLFIKWYSIDFEKCAAGST